MGRRTYGTCGYTSGINGRVLATACNCLGDNEEGTGGWLDPTSKCELLFDSEKTGMGFDRVPKTCKVFASQACKNVISEWVNYLKQRESCLKSNTPYKEEYETWLNTLNSCAVA